MHKFTWLVILLALCFSPAFGQEAVDEKMVDILKKHGLEHSQVMETAAMITDVHGPRLTGSPQLDKATEWAVQQLKDWGLEVEYRPSHLCG